MTTTPKLIFLVLESSSIHCKNRKVSIRLTGMTPFPGNDQYEIIKKNKEGVIKYEKECWNNFNPEAQKLAEAMLSKDPTKRITAEEALTHPWFSASHSSFSRFLTTQEKINRYNGCHRFKMERIKPEFVMKQYTPLLQPVVHKLTAASRTPQLPSKSIDKWKEENQMEGGKMLNKIILVRNLKEKGKIEEIQENEMNFKNEDIDEPPLEHLRHAAIELTIKHKKDSIMPKERKSEGRIGPHDKCMNRVILNTIPCRELLTELSKKGCESERITDEQ